VARWDRDPEPYPPLQPGTKVRQLDGPVAPPQPPPEPAQATRRDGTTVNWRRTVAGLAAEPMSPDERVRDWRSVL
jgi:hypothetical protein